MQRRQRARREPAELGAQVIGSSSSVAQTPPMHVYESRGRRVVDMVPLTLGTGATRLFDAEDGRKGIRYYNDGPGVIYIGGPNVSPSSGIPIQPNQGFVENDAPEAEWFAVSASTSVLRRAVVK